MIAYQSLVERWQEGPLARWADTLLEDVARDFHQERYGDLPRWLEALAALPNLQAGTVQLDSDQVGVIGNAPLDTATLTTLEQSLRALHPWRKGPFHLFGIDIDTEWRSDWKWNRLAPHISSLHGRRVLDVGCGSGYHCWRMLGAGAAEVIGIDPAPLFVVQFRALQKYIRDDRAWVLPLGIERLPARLEAFDTVFSMGILYHRHSPLGHLMDLRDCLAEGGELVLETLVIEGDSSQCLVPAGRYARMGNVWFLPSPAMLCTWLTKLGYRNVRVVDVNQTSITEQRSTEWMQFHSLAQFLDPDNSDLTVEGYPAPRRAILLANKGSGH